MMVERHKRVLAMDDLTDDVDGWREAILQNAHEARQELRSLNERDHASYIRVARQLMQDSHTTVRHEALLTWAFYQIFGVKTPAFRQGDETPLPISVLY
jgi:hypothetical protein